MAEQKESSVLFSLKELMSLEENRIRDEEAEKERRAREEAERRAAEERAKREAEEQRIREEEERRRAEELRRREEEARLEAIKHGELAKAQAEAEHRARMEALAAQQAHEQQLAALNSDHTKKRLKLYVGLAIGAVILVGVGGGLMIKSSQEQAAREKAALEAQLASLQESLEGAKRREAEAAKALENATDPAEVARLQRELEEAKEATKKASAAVGKVSGGRPVSGGSKPAPAAKPCNCPPGDPLCSCL